MTTPIALLIHSINHLLLIEPKNRQSQNVKVGILETATKLFQSADFRVEPKSPLETTFIRLGKARSKFLNQLLYGQDVVIQRLKEASPSFTIKFQKFQRKLLRDKKYDYLSYDTWTIADRTPQQTYNQLAEELDKEELNLKEKEQLFRATIERHPLNDPDFLRYRNLLDKVNTIITNETLRDYFVLRLLWADCCEKKGYEEEEETLFWFKIKQIQFDQKPKPLSNLSYFVELMVLTQPKSNTFYTSKQISEMFQDYKKNEKVLTELMDNALFHVPFSKKGKEKENFEVPGMYAPEPKILVPNWDADQEPIPMVRTKSSSSKDRQEPLEVQELVDLFEKMPYSIGTKKLYKKFRILKKCLREESFQKINRMLFVHRLSHRLFEELQLDTPTRDTLWNLFHAKATRNSLSLPGLFMKVLANHFRFSLKKEPETIQKEFIYLAFKKIWKIGFIEEQDIEKFFKTPTVDATAQEHLQRMLLASFLIDWNVAIQYFKEMLKVLPNDKRNAMINACYPHIPWYRKNYQKLFETIELYRKNDAQIENYKIAQLFFTEWCQKFPQICPKTAWQICIGEAHKRKKSPLFGAIYVWHKIVSHLTLYKHLNVNDFIKLLKNPDERHDLIQCFLEFYLPSFLIKQKFEIVVPPQSQTPSSTALEETQLAEFSTALEPQTFAQTSQNDENSNKNAIDKQIDEIVKDNDLCTLKVVLGNLLERDVQYVLTILESNYPIFFEEYIKSIS